MSDQEFLMWIHERLRHVHNESELLDYMHKLRAIISAMPVGQVTPNDGRGGSDLDDLRKRPSAGNEGNLMTRTITTITAALAAYALALACWLGTLA